MMAHDSSSQRPRALSDTTTAVLRSAVLGHLGRTPGSASDGALGHAVGLVVAEAREREMRAEDLILAFKALYDALPEPGSAAQRAEQMRLRERLVTACINAYYGVDVADGLDHR